MYLREIQHLLLLLGLLTATVTEMSVVGVQSCEVQGPRSVGADGGQDGLRLGWRQSLDHRDFLLVMVSQWWRW